MKRPVLLKRDLFFGSAIGIAAVLWLMLIEQANRPNVELSISRVVDVHNEEMVKTLDFRFPIMDTNDDKAVVMRVRNPSRRMVTFGKEKAQPKAGGQWLEATDVSWLNSDRFVAYVPARSEQEFVVAVVPRTTESLRLVLEYHCESLPERWHTLRRP